MGKFSQILDKKTSAEPVIEARSVDAGIDINEAEKVVSKDERTFVKTESGSIGVWDERVQKVGGMSNSAAESFRILRSRILHPLDDKPPPRTILVTSAEPEEGKTFVATNLAITLAQGMDQYSMLVDCDLRNPSVGKMFGIGNGNGLTNYLEAGDDIGGLIQKSAMDKLSLLTSGISPSNPSELLGSEKMNKLVKELSSRYEDRLIIFDTPPLHIASESLVLSQKVDGVILVVRFGGAGRENVLRALDNIGRERIIGVVFNGVESNLIEQKMLKFYSHQGNYSGQAP